MFFGIKSLISKFLIISNQTKSIKSTCWCKLKSSLNMQPCIVCGTVLSAMQFYTTKDRMHGFIGKEIIGGRNNYKEFISVRMVILR